MKFYVEAFQADGSQILGNLDGQAVLYCQDPYRTKHVKALLSGIGRPKWARVACWHLVRENGELVCKISNLWAMP